MNELILLCMEMVGTVAFALSGAMTALRRQMDLLGVMILGLITAVGAVCCGICCWASHRPRYLTTR